MTLLLFVTLLCIAEAKTIIVPTNYATLTSAVYAAKPGDVIQLRGGTYNHSEIIFGGKGNATNPIIVQGYPGDSRPIYDGTNVTKNGNQGLIQFWGSSYVTIEGLQVQNYPAGFQIWNGNNVVVRDLILHDFYAYCMTMSGENCVARDNLCYRGVLMNQYFNSSWLQCMTTLAQNSTMLSLNLTFENNTVHTCYGEGIDFTDTGSSVIRNNTVYDTFSTNIYADNCRDMLIDSNTLYTTSAWGHHAAAINIGTESWANPSIVASNITIINNLGFNTGAVFGYVHGVNYYTNIRVYHNTFWNASQGVYLAAIPTVNATSTGNEMRNNIFDAPTFTIPAANLQNWNFSSNVFLSMSSVPSQAKDDQNAPKSFAYASDTKANLFTKSGSPPSVSGAPVASWFRPGTNSTLRGNGTKISSSLLETSVDFFNVTRSQVPDIGFAQYQTIKTGADTSSATSSFAGLSLISYSILMLWNGLELN